MADRAEFSSSQKDQAYVSSAMWVRRKWPELGNVDHYFCTSCGFVHWDRSNFQVDHEYAAALGGHNDRHSADVAAALSGPQPDVALAYRVGVNADLLCKQCNASKQDRSAPRDGMGYAFTRPEEDLNPDHRYHGRPMSGRR